MLDESYYRKTDEIIARYGKEPKALIPVMQDVQAEYRYLPGELLSYIAKQPRPTALTPSTRTFLLRQRENTSSRSATVRPAMCATLPLYWRPSGKSWA